MTMHVRFERSDAILGRVPESASTYLVVGPYEWVQLTYAELRVAPDGDVIAYLEDDGDWRLAEPTPVGQPSRGGDAARVVALHASKPDLEYPFSDVVVY